MIPDKKTYNCLVKLSVAGEDISYELQPNKPGKLCEALDKYSTLATVLHGVTLSFLVKDGKLLIPHHLLDKSKYNLLNGETLDYWMAIPTMKLDLKIGPVVDTSLYSIECGERYAYSSFRSILKQLSGSAAIFSSGDCFAKQMYNFECNILAINQGICYFYQS